VNGRAANEKIIVACYDKLNLSEEFSGE